METICLAGFDPKKHEWKVKGTVVANSEGKKGCFFLAAMATLETD